MENKNNDYPRWPKEFIGEDVFASPEGMKGILNVHDKNDANKNFVWTTDYK